MSIKTTFTIKDLESLTGIKAHTIRIWEQRYNLLQPHRTETNIRRYNLTNLKKILNVASLYHNGYQVSEIAGMSEDDLKANVQLLGIKDKGTDKALQSFKVAMLTFDVPLFQNTWKQLETNHSFEVILEDIIFSLLRNIGMLWTTDTIKPAHERFISTLIIQKIINKIEDIPLKAGNGKYTYVLFLPLNENHEIGLLYIHYRLLTKGQRSIYLGQSIPIDNLEELQKAFSPIRFISSSTVEPQKKFIGKYFKQFADVILTTNDDELHITGKNIEQIKSPHPSIIKHSNISSMLNTI